MQGPVVLEDDMTFQTLRLYRKTMPGCELILSTWRDTDTHAIRRIKSLGVHVVMSEPPTLRGPQNLNLQIASTASGLAEAERLGCRYAMKTRADTRIHMSNVDQFCVNLLRLFPLPEHASRQSRQQARLITLDFATRLYIPYHPSDMMMFGTIEDMLRYWSPELCPPEQTYEHCSTFGESFDKLLDQAIPEVVLCHRFFEPDGFELTGDLQNWWKLLSERFIVIDREMIHHFWRKNHLNQDLRCEIDWDNTNMALCRFAQWSILNSDLVAAPCQLEELRKQKMYDRLDTQQLLKSA